MTFDIGPPPHEPPITIDLSYDKSLSRAHNRKNISSRAWHNTRDYWNKKQGHPIEHAAEWAGQKNADVMLWFDATYPRSPKT